MTVRIGEAGHTNQQQEQVGNTYYRWTVIKRDGEGAWSFAGGVNHTRNTHGGRSGASQRVVREKGSVDHSSILSWRNRARGGRRKSRAARG